MNKISAHLQKMKYDNRGEVIEVICLVDKATKGGEYTLCGNAIPDSTIEFDGSERIGEEFKGAIKDVTCCHCMKK